MCGDIKLVVWLVCWFIGELANQKVKDLPFFLLGIILNNKPTVTVFDNILSCYLRKKDTANCMK